MISKFLTRYRLWMATIQTETEGQGLVEYALIIVFIILAVMAALMGMADAITDLFNQVREVLVPALGG